MVQTGMAWVCAKPATCSDAACDQRPPPRIKIGARRPEQPPELRHFGRPGRGLNRHIRERILDRDPLGQHVLGQAYDHRAGPSIAGGVKGARDDFRHTRGLVDLGRPFGHRAKYGPIVELLKGLAFARVARNLADEYNHRRRILARDVNAGRSVGRPRPASDETNAWMAGRLANGFGHNRRPALLPAYRDGKIAVAKRVEHREVAFARHAEHVTHAVDSQLVDQNLSGRAVIGLAAHQLIPVIKRSRFAARYDFDCRAVRR